MNIKSMTFAEMCGDGLFKDGDWIESKDQDPNGEVRIIQLADIGVGQFIDKSSRFMTLEKTRELNCTYLQEGDILIARMPDPIGRACILPAIPQVCVTAVDVCIVRLDSEIIDSRWLMHKINSSGFNHQILQFVTGTTRKRISRGNLSKLKIDIPPLDEQKRIAAILDKLDEINGYVNPSSDLRNSLIDSVFYNIFNIGENGESDWPVYKLNDLVLPIQGSMRDGPFGSNLKSSDFVETGIKVIRTQNLKKTGYVDQNVAYISTEKARELAKYEFKPGDLVIAKLGKYPGVAAVIPESCGSGIIPADIVRFRGKPELINHHYLAIFLNSPLGTRQIARHFRGSTRTRVNLTALREINITTPPLDLQIQFVQIVRKIKQMSSIEELSNLSIKSISQEMLT